VPNIDMHSGNSITVCKIQMICIHEADKSIHSHLLLNSLHVMNEGSEELVILFCCSVCRIYHTA